MHTEQETIQTVLLNVMLNNDGATTEELKNALIHAQLIKPTEESMHNTIRAGMIALRRRFKKQFRIELLRTNPAINQKRYTPTTEAYLFCMDNLLEEMYDEDGNQVGYYFQHPIAISKERIDLI
tara:strand:- start:2045 stop:2416 length:372 start_codon:yes stop_codon:yes gene_type:complete